MALPATIGVDIGTSSSKGVLVAADGTVLRTEVREHRVSRPAPGHVEHDGTVWWEEFVSISRALVAAAASAEVSIGAVGVSGMGPCVLLTDDAGTPVRPAILYGVDSRAGEEITELEEQLGTEVIERVGGTGLTSQAAGPKIRWVARHEPDAFARASRFFMPASYLAFQLTGAYVLDHHSASQCWPLYDIDGSQWHMDHWRDIADGLTPPDLRHPEEVAGEVSVAAAAVTGLPAGIPVITGTIDAWNEAVSAGAVNTGDLMLMYGTTMFLITTTADRPAAPGMWTTRGVAAGTYSLAGGMATSGAITGWIRDLVGGTSYTELTDQARASGVGARGLLMLPYFAGERTPVQDPDARGTIVGLTLEHTAGDLYRAALEATAYGVRHNVETMQQAGFAIDRIVAVGGGTTGGLWTQIVSDVTGLPQEVPTVTVGASFGAAFLAAGAVAKAASAPAPRINDWNPAAVRVVPDAAAHDVYAERYTHYLGMYPALRDTMHALAREPRRRS